MIKFNRAMQRYEFYSLKATFEAHGEPSFKYTDDRHYWEEFVRRWWHHTNLNFEQVRPTPEQQARLEEVNGFGDNGLWLPDLSLYVEHNAIHPDTGCPYLVERAADPVHVEAYLETIRQRLRRTLAAHRYKVEVGGYVLPNGVRLHTGREDQAMLNSAFQTLSQPFVTEVDWKAPTGWIKVDLETIRPLAQHCTYHVQSCFSAERRVDEILTNITDHHELNEFDVKAAFDEQYQILLSEHLAAAAST